MVERCRGGEDEEEIERNQRRRDRGRIGDQRELEGEPQRVMGEIGRIADLAEPVERPRLERVAAPAGGEREREQQRGEGGGNAQCLAQWREQQEQRGRGGEGGGRPPRAVPAQPERADRSAAGEFENAADQPQVWNILAKVGGGACGEDGVEQHQQGGDRGQHGGGGNAPPVDRQREQREEEIGAELARDRPGRVVPGERIGEAPVLEQQQMERQFGHRIWRRRAAGGGEQQRQRQRHAEHDGVERPDACDAAAEEIGDGAQPALAQPIGIGEPDHHSGEQEEEVDREIALAEQRRGGRWQACDRLAQVEEHDQPRRDSARRGEGAELSHAGASCGLRIGRHALSARLRAT